MHKASPELCKELSKLSGWKTPYFSAELGDTENVDQQIRYDLGYLLRKLPRYVAIEIDDVISATHTNQEHRDFVEFADTPEDAAALLAIQLIKEGILQGEKK